MGLSFFLFSPLSPSSSTGLSFLLSLLGCSSSSLSSSILLFFSSSFQSSYRLSFSPPPSLESSYLSSQYFIFLLYRLFFLTLFSIRFFHLFNSSIPSPCSSSSSSSPHTRVWNQATTINIKHFQATKSVKLRKHGTVCSRRARIFPSSF